MAFTSSFFFNNSGLSYYPNRNSLTHSRLRLVHARVRLAKSHLNHLLLPEYWSKMDNGKDLRCLSLSYTPTDPQTSALRLVLTLFPDWEHAEGAVEFIRFKDGITNTVSNCLLDLCKTSLSLLVVN